MSARGMDFFEEPQDTVYPLTVHGLSVGVDTSMRMRRSLGSSRPASISSTLATGLDGVGEGVCSSGIDTGGFGCLSGLVVGAGWDGGAEEDAGGGCGLQAMIPAKPRRNMVVRVEQA